MHGLDSLWTALIAIVGVAGAAAGVIKWRSISAWFKRASGPQALQNALTIIDAYKEQFETQTAKLEAVETELAAVKKDLGDKVRRLEREVDQWKELATSRGAIEDLTKEVRKYRDDVAKALGGGAEDEHE